MIKFEEISPSDFFYRNKEIAGFENPAKACYTIVREFLENSLDACELGGFLPEIEIYMKSVNEEEKRLRIKVIDNGIGVPHDKIPLAFGKILYSSKYVLRQHRGIFGLGGKMAVLYSQITTNNPFRVISATPNNGYISFYELKIDILRNEPIILKRSKIINQNGWHGLILECEFIGDYLLSKKKIFEYLFQTSIAVPYARIYYQDYEGNALLFERKTDKIPPIPEETLLHPKGVDLEMLKRLIKINPNLPLNRFLAKNFQRIGQKAAEEILKLANIEFEKPVSKLTEEEIVRLYNVMKSYPFKRPSANSLSPLGESFAIGIKETFNPEFLSYDMREPSSFEGHPFIVETAIAYGGDIPIPEQNEINLFRFANKIPLIYDSYNDVSMKVIKNINWSIYKLNIYQEPIAFFVHICSTKIPYKTLGKEYIANQPEIYKEIELSLRKNARLLSAYINKKRIIEYQKIRYKYLKEYIEKIANFACILANEDPKKIKNSIVKLVEINDAS
jgi:DNA topoisomerase-6 subunit B